ncbi:MAG: trypsin-like serine protease [Polyangiaceae bacterium]
MTRVGLAVASILAVFSAAACSAQKTDGESVTQSGEPIQGGSDDTAHPFVMGFCVAEFGGGIQDCKDLQADICTGALIAPNVVVTARHCVQQTDEAIDCSTSVFGSARTSASNMFVTTSPTFAGSSTASWHQVAKVTVPTPTGVCGNDIAILTLTKNVAATEATPVIPVVQYSMSTRPMFSRQVTAIGYGATQADPNGQPPGAGTKRIKTNISLECTNDDPLFKTSCAAVYAPGGGVDGKEFVTGAGTCQGDSGSSAWDQALFNKGQFYSFGVLSRGGENGTTCEDAVYTRLDSWRDLLVQVVTDAAAEGGYTVPDWTKPAPPVVDAGPPPKTKSAFGDTCDNDSDCESGSCLDSQCTQACDSENVPCPDGYTCNRDGLCAVTTDDDAGSNGATTTTTTSCGCTLAGGPNSPVPWKTVSLAVVGLAMLRRRRRGATK